MYAEVFAGYAVFVFILLYLTELSNKKPIGIIASLLLLLLGVWLIGDSTIYIRTGETTLNVENITVSTVLNSTLTGTVLTNGTETLGLDNVTNSSFTALSSENSDGTGSEFNVRDGSSTTTYDYTALSMPYLPIPLGQMIAFTLIGLGIYGTAAYAVDTFTQPI